MTGSSQTPSRTVLRSARVKSTPRVRSAMFGTDLHLLGGNAGLAEAAQKLFEDMKVGAPGVFISVRVGVKSQ